METLSSAMNRGGRDILIYVCAFKSIMKYFIVISENVGKYFLQCLRNCNHWPYPRPARSWVGKHHQRWGQTTPGW